MLSRSCWLSSRPQRWPRCFDLRTHFHSAIRLCRAWKASASPCGSEPTAVSILATWGRVRRVPRASWSLRSGWALNNIVPLTVVPTLPFVFESKAHQRRALDGALGRDLLASLEPAGLVGLALYDSGSYCFFSRTGFVNTVADLRGKRIRFQKGDTSDVMFRALGAQPMTVPHSQLFAALKSGAIDVVEGSLSDYLALNFFTVAPYFTVSQHAEPPSILIMSRRRWESLSKNDQELVRQAAEASVESQRTLMDAYEAQAMARASEMGTGLSYDFDRQSFRDAFASLYSLVVREPQQFARVKQLAVGEAEPARPKGTK